MGALQKRIRIASIFQRKSVLRQEISPTTVMITGPATVRPLTEGEQTEAAEEMGLQRRGLGGADQQHSEATDISTALCKS